MTAGPGRLGVGRRLRSGGSGRPGPGLRTPARPLAGADRRRKRSAACLRSCSSMSAPSLCPVGVALVARGACQEVAASGFADIDLAALIARDTILRFASIIGGLDPTPPRRYTPTECETDSSMDLAPHRTSSCARVALCSSGAWASSVAHGSEKLADRGWLGRCQAEAGPGATSAPAQRLRIRAWSSATPLGPWSDSSLDGSRCGYWLLGHVPDAAEHRKAEEPRAQPSTRCRPGEFS